MVTKRAKIQVFHASTGASVGWVYRSNGPAITGDPAIAVVVTYEILEGATSASQVRFTFQDSLALGFNAPMSLRLEDY